MHSIKLLQKSHGACLDSTRVGKALDACWGVFAQHASPIRMAIAQDPSACTLDEILNTSSINTLSREKLLLMAANNVLPVYSIAGAHARIRLHGDQMLAPRHARSLSAAPFHSSQSPTPFNRGLQSVYQFNSLISLIQLTRWPAHWHPKARCVDSPCPSTESTTRMHTREARAPSRRLSGATFSRQRPEVGGPSLRSNVWNKGV